MNREKIIKLAEECGVEIYSRYTCVFPQDLERFAAAIEAEKDAIILVLEKELKALKNYRDLLSEVLVETYNRETEQSKIIAGQQARIETLSEVLFRYASRDDITHEAGVRDALSRTDDMSALADHRIQVIKEMAGLFSANGSTCFQEAGKNRNGRKEYASRIV